MAKQKVASELTALQRELLQALVESGISKDSLLRACSALFTVKQEPESGEAAQVKTSSEAQHANEHSRGSTPQQNTPIKNTGNEELHGRDTHAEGQQPITFLDQMLRMDPWQAAKLVKMYMQQHNIPQREVVESTGLNQSHLSQHLNKGTPMKTNKRAVLYTWFENKRKEVVEQYTTPGKRPVPGIGASSASSSKKPRRNRFKWGPASTGILYQSYEEQKNPSKDEREALVVACNRAECNQRGVPYHNVEGLGPNLVTESRVYNWFANRRKEETFRMKLAIDAANYSETSVTPTAGQVAVSQALMSQNTNTVMSPMMDHGTSMPATPKAAIPQSGLPCPAMPSVPVTTEMQHPSLAQHMMQPIGTHAGQHQEMQMVGNFVSAMHHQQMPLGMAMMPHPGVPVSTCQVAVQPQMIPVSSMAQHQQPPMVPGMGQMPVIVSVQPGIPDGMQHHPENMAQMTGAAPFVQMHHVPITTLPMPPPLQPITCNDMTLPPPLQPLTVVSPMVQMAPRPSIQVGTPSNIRNQITPQVEPQSPVYDVKLDTPAKDVIVERTDSTTVMSSPDKAKNESKSDVIEVENGDDETVIAETITVITLAEDLNSECAETSDDDKKGNIKRGGTKDLSKSIAVSLSNTSSQEQSSCQSNGKS